MHALALVIAAFAAIPCAAPPVSTSIPSTPTVSALRFSTVSPQASTHVIDATARSWLLQVVRVLLVFGMVVAIGFYLCCEKSPYFVILFLLFLCLFLLASPTKETDGESTYSWPALVVSGLLVLGMVSSIGCYLWGTNTPYFILVFMLLLNIMLLIWKPISLF